jgi:hypothetical protein
MILGLVSGHLVLLSLLFKLLSWRLECLRGVMVGMDDASDAGRSFLIPDPSIAMSLFPPQLLLVIRALDEAIHCRTRLCELVAIRFV